MSANSDIQWTDSTWNPTVGCDKVSPGCRSCYAKTMHARLTAMGQLKYAEPFEMVKPWPPHLAQPLGWTKPQRIFVNSMSDLFHEDVPDEYIAAVFGVMAACPQHTFQCLTKRAERMAKWFEWATPIVIEKFKHIAIEGRTAEYFADERTEAISGWPGYFVTSRGRVLSDRKGPRHDLKPMAEEKGHHRVMLYRGEGSAREECRPLVHRLVLEHFDRCARDDEQGRHVDGDPSNNALWNLAWGTQSENWNDRRRHGNGRSYHKLNDEQVEAIRSGHSSGRSLASLAAEFDVSATQVKNIVAKKQWVSSAPTPWPLPWVWLGVSVEDQQRADERIPHLLRTPAAIRFLSCEPLLGPVDLRRIGVCRGEPLSALEQIVGAIERPPVDWVIVGGESGPGARRTHASDIRSIVHQCRKYRVPCFVKQMGAVVVDRNDVGFEAEHDVWAEGPDAGQPTSPDAWPTPRDVEHDIDGHREEYQGAPVRIRLANRKGGDMSEWPADLRVREFPRSVAPF